MWQQEILSEVVLAFIKDMEDPCCHQGNMRHLSLKDKEANAPT